MTLRYPDLVHKYARGELSFSAATAIAQRRNTDADTLIDAWNAAGEYGRSELLRHIRRMLAEAEP